MNTRTRPILVSSPAPSQELTLRDLPNVSSRAYRTGRNLVLMTVVVVVVNRFFTEVVPVLPRAFNFIDVPLVGLLLLYAIVGMPERRSPGFRPGFMPGMTAFAAIWGISALMNLSRVHPYPALLFLYGFLGPLLAYVLAYRIWPVGQAAAMSRTVIGLGIVQFGVVALFNLPRFATTGNPDHMSGTFGENAYQLVFFLLIFGALVAGTATFQRRTLTARLAAPMIGASFLLIFLAQYRSLLLTTALVAGVTVTMISVARGRGLAIGAVTLVGLSLGFMFVVTNFPRLRFDRAVSAIREDPQQLLAGKIEAVQNVGRLHAEDLKYAVIGAGPGTYSSRAWRTFALLGTPGGHADVAGLYVSALQGGRAYRTDVSDRYVRPQVEARQDILGSRVLAAPFSSYLALPTEVGFAGATIMLVIYFTALSGTFRRALASMRRAPPGDPLPALALAAAISLFVLLQAAFLDNWLEGARVTIPSWILVAVTTKEYQARKMLGWAPIEGPAVRLRETADASGQDPSAGRGG